MLNANIVENFSNGLVNNLINRFGRMIESWHGWKNMRFNFCSQCIIMDFVFDVLESLLKLRV
jgi:hypothetical protein